MRIEVYGNPGPQGSKRYVGNGLMVESSKLVKPWREAVKWAVLDSMPHQGFCFHGPIAVMMTFTLRKPKSAPKNRKAYPDKAPDADKLARSTNDALTQSGIIEDDARIVLLHVCKTYPREHRDALPSPGSVIRIENYTGTIPPDWIERTE